jgi:hypothetical protein
LYGTVFIHFQTLFRIENVKIASKIYKPPTGIVKIKLVIVRRYARTYCLEPKLITVCENVIKFYYVKGAVPRDGG